MARSFIKALRFLAYGVVLLALTVAIIGVVQGRSGTSSKPSNSPPVRQNHYETLNVTIEATDSDLRRAYRKQVLKYHPDKFQRLSAAEQEEAKANFDRVTAAYDFLLSSDGRCEYDRDVMNASTSHLKQCNRRVRLRREERLKEQEAERAARRAEMKKAEEARRREEKAEETRRRKEKTRRREETEPVRPSVELATHILDSMVEFVKAKSFSRWVMEVSLFWLLRQSLGWFLRATFSAAIYLTN
ncbi:hypothetical protein F4859DRAFT_523792 [Xylaria cf. heliscus]|nr:hypothetical protein F4859DRAFT_523792 [Xylaria cf. heliscus]